MKFYYIKETTEYFTKGDIVFVDFDHPQTLYSPAWSNLWILATPSKKAKRIQVPFSFQREMKDKANPLYGFPRWLKDHINRQVVQMVPYWLLDWNPDANFFKRKFKR